jgi:hypothetical protein
MVRVNCATPQSVHVKPPRYGLDHRDIAVQLPDGGKRFSPLPQHPRNSRTHLVPYPRGKGKGTVKFTLEQATKTQRDSTGIALLFNLGARWGGWSTPRPDRFTPGKDPVPTVQEAGWAPGPDGTGAENLAPTRIRSPDRLARSESLYRLRYCGPSYPRSTTVMSRA